MQKTRRGRNRRHRVQRVAAKRTAGPVYQLDRAEMKRTAIAYAADRKLDLQAVARIDREP